MTIKELNNIAKENLTNLELARKKISELIDTNHDYELKLSKITNLFIKYGKKLGNSKYGREFIDEYVNIFKDDEDV